MSVVRWLAGWRHRRSARRTLTRLHEDGGYRISPWTDDFLRQCNKAWREWIRNLGYDPDGALCGQEDLEEAFKDGFSAAWAKREFRHGGYRITPPTEQRYKQQARQQ